MKHKKKKMVNEIYWSDSKLAHITLLKVKFAEAMKKKEDEEESIPYVNNKTINKSQSWTPNWS